MADSGNNRIAKFNATGTFLRNIASGSATGVLALTIDQADLIWFTTPVGRDVYAYDSTGNYVAYYYGALASTSAQSGYFRSPRGIAALAPLPMNPYSGRSALVIADGDGQTLQTFTPTAQPTAHVALPSIPAIGTFQGQIAFDSAQNAYFTSGNTVYKVNKFGEPLSNWGSAGSGNGQFNFAYGIAIDNSDNVYVADTNNHRIQKFTSTGTFIAQFGAFGSGDGQFSSPAGLACDGTDLYVADEANNRVQKFTLTGVWVRKWGIAGTGPGQMSNPAGIAVDQARGAVYVSEYFGQRIHQFSVFGDFIKIFADSTSGTGALTNPRGLATDQRGNLYVCDKAGSDARAVQFNGNGTFLSNFPVANCNGMAVEPISGRLWVGSTSSDGVRRFGRVIGKSDTVGVYRPSEQRFELRPTNSDGAPSIAATVAGATAADRPLTGDWNGDGIDSAGLFRPSTGLVYLWDRWSNLSIAAPDYSFAIGNADDQPIAGDWNGDGSDDAGIFRSSSLAHHLLIGLAAPVPAYIVGLAQFGDTALAGDWDLDGAASAGAFRPSVGRSFVSNRNVNGAVAADASYPLGSAQVRLFTGDWTNSAYTGLGAYRAATGQFVLKHDLDESAPNATFTFAPTAPSLLFRDGLELAPLEIPLAGRWGGPPE